MPKVNIDLTKFCLTEKYASSYLEVFIDKKLRILPLVNNIDTFTV